MDKFVVYKSSAGSGKTYTLVREYIALALASPSYFRHILAVTFTNKAANEMKQRVILSLRHLAEPKEYSRTATIRHMLPDLVGRTGFPRTLITEKAGQVLRSILHNYDDFAVRTIDSFVARIIRTFAHDLKLPSDFEIELDKDTLLRQAVDQLIAKAGTESELTRILVEFTETKSNDEKSWHIEKDLVDAGSLLFEESSLDLAPKLEKLSPAFILETSGRMRHFLDETRTLVSSEAAKACSIFQSKGISPEDFYYGKQGIGSFFLNLSRGELQLPNARVLATVEKDNWAAGKTDKALERSIQDIKDDLYFIFQEIKSLLEQRFEKYQLILMISRNIYQLGIISAIENELDEIRKEKKLIHVSEFNKRITNIIIREPVPFIYERTGEKYRHYLLDEFQDTSELQWKNLLPLITNSLANGHFNLVVGDGKQAIYRFRNGEVEQFMLLPELPGSYDPVVFRDAAVALASNYREMILRSNFRSMPVIVSFNNDFFRYAASRLDESYRRIFDEHEQFPDPGKSGGMVRIEKIPASDGEEFLEISCEKTFEIVRDLGDHGCELKDIVILTRTNQQGNRLARFLIGKGIDVVSAEALLLSASPEVNLLISALQFIRNPDDKIALAGILIQLRQQDRILDELENLGDLLQNGTWKACLEKHSVDFQPEYWRRLPVYDLCEELVRSFGLGGSPYNPYIQFFLEFVYNCTKSGTPQVSDLLDLWDEKKNKLSVIVPEGIQAVRIMTVHKAKGLEFPVVILPFATDAFKITKDNLWIQPVEAGLPGLDIALVPYVKALAEVGYGEEYEEERNKSLLDLINLIYVAFTRPVEQLYILTKEVTSTASVSLPVLLREYIAQSGLDWRQKGTAYILGNESEHVLSHEPAYAADGGKLEMLSEPWQHKVKIAIRSPESWTAGKDTGSKEWGIWVHDLLSVIDPGTDIPEQVRKYFASKVTDPEIPERMAVQIAAVLSNPELSELFGKQSLIKAEQGILLPDGTMARPDRVIYDGETINILEFKTGSPREEHARQLGTYVDVVRKMVNKTIVAKLVYINNEVVDIKEI